MASSSSQISSSSASTPTNWDVFLNFCGEDTRYNFTSHLYSALDRHGIRTFMDDPELRTGEVISDALLGAIQESKTYIVVLSENYASSSWCLDELVEILNCHEKMQRLIIPVFYRIDPSTVRRQTGSYNKAFEKHEFHFAGLMERVENWRLTLRQVADKSGKHIYEKRSEADIINEIVDQILLEINPMALLVAKYPVGLDSRVEGITALLSSGTKGVIKVGIYGMGGVGKTTLAKALFNQLLPGSFKGSCFLANVREISGTLKGLESLQQQLINHVLKCKNKFEVSSVDQGTKLIGSRICSTQILVVIDDLDDHMQFESLVGPFALGSVVIITTRDEEILDKIEVEPKYRYRVNELDDAESLSLFSKHAFRNTKPDNYLLVLCKDILRHAGGLPLALEIFGSYLYKKSEVGWKSFIEKLQRIPNSSIQERLIVSLDALESDDPMLKKLFLDIACFFIGSEREQVVEIMGTYYPYADNKIDILKKKCLLTINDSDELRMHDLLQDMGREIARNNSPDEPGKHSRLWVSEEICEVLKNHKGTEAIEGIKLEYEDPSKEVSFAMEAVRKMRKLRFLYLRGINLTGNFEQTLENLRWFCWYKCPLECLPLNFCPRELVMLELPYSKMTRMWELNMVSQVFKKLKILNMSYSRVLTATPDFTKLLCLKTLNLEGCYSLEEVHISVGSLVTLVSLDLRGCKKLRSLPDSICNLRALKSLNIEDCSGLKALPEELGNIKSLTEINACGLHVSKLPDSIGCLSNLVKLILDFNINLETLPDTICNLRALKILQINSCTSLDALPKELGNLVSLTKISATGLKVSKLPVSIGCLSKLVKLEIDSNTKLETLPNTICNLRALEVLDISYCTNLEALPVKLGDIESLIKLDVNGLTVSKLPDSIGSLTKLVRLDLRDNKKLETLPDTICNLRSLEILDIDACEKLVMLPDELWKITRLRNLDAGGTTLLKKLPDIRSSQIVSSLQDLYFYESGITSLPSGFSQLSNLQYLEINWCHHLLSIPELPPNLKRIDAKSCISLEKLPNLSNLKHLEEMDLSYCSGLTEIQGLEELTSLRNLHLRGCNSSLLTKRLFQIYSGFKHKICIESEKFPYWISQDWSSLYLLPNVSNDSSEEEFSDDSLVPKVATVTPELPTVSFNLTPKLPTVSFNLPPKVSHDYLGMILCFKCYEWQQMHEVDFSVTNSAGNLLFSDRQVLDFDFDSCMVIVPRSIFAVTDADTRIKLTNNGVAEVLWIRLLLKPEFTVTAE